MYYPESISEAEYLQVCCLRPEKSILLRKCKYFLKSSNISKKKLKLFKKNPIVLSKRQIIPKKKKNGQQKSKLIPKNKNFENVNH